MMFLYSACKITALFEISKSYVQFLPRQAQENVKGKIAMRPSPHIRSGLPPKKRQARHNLRKALVPKAITAQEIFFVTICISEVYCGRKKV